MATTKHQRAAKITSRQHGLITRKQAQQVGFTSSTIQRMRTSGMWTTKGTGVYAVAGAPRTWHQRVLAVCLELNAVASHRTAAVLLDVSGFRQGPVEVTVRRHTKLSRSGARVHESLDVDLIKPILVDGIPTTPPARLAVDLGSVVKFERYEAAIDQLIGRRAVSWDDLYRTLILHAVAAATASARSGRSSTSASDPRSATRCSSSGSCERHGDTASRSPSPSSRSATVTSSSPGSTSRSSITASSSSSTDWRTT